MLLQVGHEDRLSVPNGLHVLSRKFRRGYIRVSILQNLVGLVCKANEKSRIGIDKKRGNVDSTLRNIGKSRSIALSKHSERI